MAIVYNRNILGVPPEEPPDPKIKEQFSWDEFFQGLAEGGARGVGMGINLSDAARARDKDQLATLRANPDLADYEYQRRQDALQGPRIDQALAAPTMNISSEYTDPLGDYGTGTAVPPRAVVDLGAIKEARDRAAARRIYGFSEETDKEMKSITDRNLEMFKREQARKDLEVENADVKKTADDLAAAETSGRRLKERMKKNSADLAEAERSGDREAFARLANEAEALRRQSDEANAKYNDSVSRLEMLGFTEDDYKGLFNPATRISTLNNLLRRRSGSSRVRQPGSR